MCDDCIFESFAPCRFPCFLCLFKHEKGCMGCINFKRKQSKRCADNIQRKVKKKIERQ